MPVLQRFERREGIPFRGPRVRGAGGGLLTAPGRALAAGFAQVGAAVFQRGAVRKRARDRELARLQKLADANALTAATSAITRGIASIEDKADPLAPDFVPGQVELIATLIEDTISGIPEGPAGGLSISPEAMEVLNARATALGDKASGRSLKRARDAMEKQGVDNLAASSNEIFGTLRRNPARLLVGLEAIDGLYEDYAGTLDADTLRDEKAAARADAIEASVRGFVDQGNFNGAHFILADERFDRDLTESARNTLINEVEAAEKGARAGAKKLVDTVGGILKIGETPPADELAAARAAAAPFDGLKADLIAAERLGEFAGELRREPTVVMQNVINTLRAQRIKTTEDVERLVAAQTILREADTALERDPLSWGARAGVVDLKPLDPTDPASVRARVVAAAKVESTYGVDVVPFTDEETADTVRSYENADANGRLGIMRALVDMRMPPRMLDDALNALNDKAPEMGLIADLVTRDLLTARRVLLGQEFLRNNPGQVPKKTDVDNELDATLGDALRADLTGRTRAAVVAAANGFYVQGRIGEEPGFESDEYGDAIEAVVGTIIERNGQHTILPPGVTEDRFDTGIDGLTDEALHRVPDLDPAQAQIDVPLGPHRLTAAGLSPVTAAEMKDDGRLITVGPGRYFVAFGVDRPGLFTGEDLEFAVDAAGDPYVLDFKQIEKGEAVKAEEIVESSGEVDQPVVLEKAKALMDRPQAKAASKILEPSAKGSAVVERSVEVVDKLFPGAALFLFRVARAESNLGRARGTFRTASAGGSLGIFQTDRNTGFAETKNVASHPGLARAHEKIRTALGIDWQAVEFEDLRKPLISALAARLFLLTIPERIPDTLRDQAEYWKKHYNTAKGKGTAARFIAVNAATS